MFKKLRNFCCCYILTKLHTSQSFSEILNRELRFLDFAQEGMIALDKYEQ